MAVIYYPSSSLILQRTTSGSNYTEIVISNEPNAVFFFDTGSQIAQLSQSVVLITASWAQTTISASYVATASYSLGGLTSSYSILSKTSSYIDTASYSLASKTASFIDSSSYSLSSSYAANSSAGGITASYYALPVQSARLPATNSATIDAGLLTSVNQLGIKLQ
jgi:hypothetical protein